MIGKTRIWIESVKYICLNFLKTNRLNTKTFDNWVSILATHIRVNAFSYIGYDPFDHKNVGRRVISILVTIFGKSIKLFKINAAAATCFSNFGLQL